MQCKMAEEYNSVTFTDVELKFDDVAAESHP